MVMATSSGRCYTTALLLASFWLLTTAGDVNYRDIVIGRKSSYMSQYFRRLYRRQRHCEEPELTERVRLADVVLTGTIRALEVDAEQPDCEVARVEVKRVIKESSRRQADAGAGRRRGRDSINVRRIGDETVCGSDANLRDSWIFLLQHDRDDVTFHLNSSLIRITLTNIDRIEQLVRSSQPQQQQRAPVRLSSRPTTTTTTTSATATTTTTTTTRTTERDACATWTCHHGASCVLEHRRPRCVCPPYNCSTAAGDEGLGPVCGTDRRDYDSQCEMTAASCTLQKHIGKLYDGHCDKCRSAEKQCEFHSVCVTGSHGQAICVCPSASACPQNESSSRTCGSDGEWYRSECAMKAASCALSQHIRAVDHRHCDPCEGVQCSGRGEHCVAGRCVCRHRVCPTNYDPVCGTDSVTYPNQCTLDFIACTESRNVDTKHRGVCDEFIGGSGMGEADDDGDEQPRTATVTTTTNATTTTSASAAAAAVTTTNSSASRARRECGDSVCQFGAQCVSDQQSARRQRRCVCQFNCDAVRSVVCGSDGRLYASECLMRAESCRQQRPVIAVSVDNCEEMDIEVELCDGKEPLINSATGRQFDCDHEQCPTDSYCHRVPHQPARCCLGDESVSGGGGGGGEVVISCNASEFGCCPDGVTSARGRQHAGCPSKCRCNSLGSLSSTCDPLTSQCRCKPAVGGLRCDRCQSSYWGLQLIADSPDNGGCIPCGCNVVGSTRDDCDQMTGKCRCRPGFTGHKCQRCADDATAGPQGCRQRHSTTHSARRAEEHVDVEQNTVRRRHRHRHRQHQQQSGG